MTIDLINSDVVVAFVGLCGILITAWVGHRQFLKEYHKRTMAEREMKFQRVALDFADFMQEWDETAAQIKDLMQNTNIDRFLLLRAWNGYLNPMWTTAVFQIRQEGQHMVSYQHFELDKDYVSRLQRIASNRVNVWRTDEMSDDCAIKAVYIAEGVSSSMWCHIDHKKLGGTESATHTYCSFATHKGDIDDVTATKCALIACRLKGVSEIFR